MDAQRRAAQQRLAPPTRQTALQAFLSSKKRKSTEQLPAMSNSNLHSTSSSSLGAKNAAHLPPLRKIARSEVKISTKLSSATSSVLSNALAQERAKQSKLSRNHHMAQPAQQRTIIETNCNMRARNEMANSRRQMASQFSRARASEAAARMSGAAVPLVGEGSRSGIRGASLVREVADQACLTEMQREVFDSVMQGKSVFITGGAGVGKSYLVRAIVSALTLLKGVVVAATASTGVAAIQIGGTTLHRWAGIGTGSGDRAELLNRAKKRQATWSSTTVLIIDEISMVSADLFDNLEYLARQMRAVHTPFGGLQLIIVGDFYQLPPVSREKVASYCFEAHSWSRCLQNSFELKEIFRQRNEGFITVLNEIRRGFISDEGRTMLNNARSIKTALHINGIEATKIFPTNAAVDQINSQSLQRLHGEVIAWRCVDSANADAEMLAGAPVGATLSSSLTEQILTQLDGCLAPEELQLKIGAQVMLLRNIGGEDELDLVNGSRGVVVSLDAHAYADKDKSHSSSSASSQESGTEEEFMRRNGSRKECVLPVVQFANGKVVVVKPVEFEAACPGFGTAIRHQIPLKLAYALTIHKTQGMTIDRASLSLKNVFEYGQAYVALSRLSSLETCCVTDWNASAIRANPKVGKFYQTIETENAKRKNVKMATDDSDKSASASAISAEPAT